MLLERIRRDDEVVDVMKCPWLEFATKHILYQFT